MQKEIIFFVLLILGCNYKVAPEGLKNDVIVVSSEEDYILIKPYVEDLFDQPIFTPQKESIYNIKWIKPWEINQYKKFHNVILLSLEFPEDSTGDILLDKYLKASNTAENIFIRENIYSNNQIFLSINAFDIIGFDKIIKNKKNWIIDNINKKYDEKIIAHIYSKGLNLELMTYFENNYNISIDVQKDYMLIKESEDNNFIWIGRGYPYRWITIDKIKKGKVYSFWKDFQNAKEMHMPEINISNHYRVEELKEFENKKINIYRGVYDHVESGTGGPFVVYEIPNDQNDEVYFLSGFVNYPGHKKINLIKGIEVLFNSAQIISK